MKKLFAFLITLGLLSMFACEEAATEDSADVAAEQPADDGGEELAEGEDAGDDLSGEAMGDEGEEADDAGDDEGDDAGMDEDGEGDAASDDEDDSFEG